MAPRNELAIVHARVPAGHYPPMPGERTPVLTTQMARKPYILI